MKKFDIMNSKISVVWLDALYSNPVESLTIGKELGTFCPNRKYNPFEGGGKYGGIPKNNR